MKAAFVKECCAIGMLLLVFVFGMGRAGAEPVYETQGCGKCHRFSADEPAEERRAPDLFFAGNKFQKDWLEGWLQDPQPIRPMGYSLDPGFLKGKPEIASHPKLDAAAAKAMTEALMQLTLPDWKKAPLPDEPLSKGARFKIKMLFERDYGCIACHQSVNLTGQPRGGVSGPSFLDAGDRLQADWVYAWLTDPTPFEPKGRMPRFDLSEEDRVGLTRYVMWHNKDNIK
jgi:mono/diheme cytochrome c family protein